MKTGHWTDDDLIQFHYGVGPDDGHLEACAACRSRLGELVAARAGMEREHEPGEDVSFDLLATQRRAIYQRLGGESPFRMRRLAPVLATLTLLAGSLLMVRKQEYRPDPNAAVSDTQLVEDVAAAARNTQPPPIAPLQALFEGE